jgi:hypothetical protein
MSETAIQKQMMLNCSYLFIHCSKHNICSCKGKRSFKEGFEI